MSTQWIMMIKKLLYLNLTYQAWASAMLLISLTATCMAASSLGVTTDSTHVTTLKTGMQKTHVLQMESAHRWRLSVKEWQRYQQLMTGPAGRWYTQLNPPEVLGLLARSANERQHYAELVVLQRKARIDRELAFNRAIHVAWRKYYPHLKPIRPFDATPFQVQNRPTKK